LRAMEEMANYMKDREMASKCRKLFLSGSKWIDENLFNGEYYIHKIEVPEKQNIP
jgi:non-lysosomal glucosylceramidase